MNHEVQDDLEELNKPGGLLNVCARHAKIEGVPDIEVRATLKQFGIKDIRIIDRMLAHAIDKLSNPTDKSGKN